jgi:hypothetical protein
MTNSEIEEYLVRLDEEVLQFKEQLFRISWYMRGGVNITDLFHTYSQDDLDILNRIIKENIELTKESRMPLL